VKYTFVTAIEACVDVAQHICATQGWGLRPTTVTPSGCSGNTRFLQPTWHPPDPAGSRCPRAVTEEFYGPQTAAMYRRSGGDGPLAGRLWEGFEVHRGDLLAEKTAASAFFPGRCPLPSLLAERDINTVLISGTVTNVCCESSARDASTLGYRVIMVADANAARRDQEHNATLHTIYRSFGDVRSAADVIRMIESAAWPGCTGGNSDASSATAG
jgi:nicotinamidase-related amidase